VGLFLGTAAASDVFKAYEGNRELFKEWRRCFAEDPESSGGPEREGQCRQALPLGPIVARAFGEPFGKKARACSAFMFAAALKLPVCWIIVTLRSGPGEAAVLGAMVPGGKACPPLLSRPCGGASGPAALAGPEAAGRARVSLPVSFEGVILAGEGAMAAWFPERGGAAGAAAWGAFWNGDLKGSAPALFEPSAPLPSRAEALAGSLAAAGAGRGPARAGLAAAVIR
jgi:hypothetical protein